MKMKKALYKAFLFLLPIISFGCSTAEPDSQNKTISEDHTHELEDSSNDYTVRLTTGQIEIMKISMGSFMNMNVTTTIKSNGQLELPPQNKASVSTILSGRVKEIMVMEGSQVKKGQVLAILENPEVIELQEEYIRHTSEFEFIKNDYLRKKELYKDSINSVKEFQKAKAEYQMALAKQQGLKAKLQLLNYSISEVEKGVVSSSFNVISPIEGYVRLIEVNMGKFVEQKQEMFEIVDNDHIHMDLLVYEKDIDKVKIDQKVVFSISTHPENVFYGKVFAVGRAFQSEIKAVKVHAEITSKPTGLLPGMYVDARIIIDSNETQSVPESAIIEEGGLSYIFVVNESKSNEDYVSFNKIEINTGASDMGFVEVVTAQPVPTHPKVVIHGAYYILAEMNKGEGSGHNH